MAILSKGTDFSTGDQVTAAKLNALVDSATFASTAVDDVSTALDGSSPQKIIVKDGGISTARLADSAVTTAKIAAGAVTDIVYPVGSIFTTVNNYADSAAVVNAIGGTTWTAFGAGRVLLGLDAGDTDFDTVEKTGGAKTHTLSEGELPSHTHSVQMQAQVNRGSGSGSPNNNVARNDSGGFSASPINTGTTGSGSAHNNLQPYIVVYMWKRTA